MDKHKFYQLEQELLKGGIAPKTVKRLKVELQDHWESLYQEALALRMSPGEAADYASSQIGDNDALAASILARPELKSLAHKHAWLVFGFVPLFITVLSFIALLMAIVGFAHLIDGNALKSEVPVWLEMLAKGYIGFMSYGLHLVVIYVLMKSAVTRRANLVWPSVGGCLVAILGSVLTFSIQFPDMHGQLGSVSASMGLGLYDPPYDGGTWLNQVTLVISLVWVYVLRKQGERSLRVE